MIIETMFKCKAEVLLMRLLKKVTIAMASKPD